jgi:hypothetical protein
VRPSDKKTIDYFIHMGKILSNSTDDNIGDDGEMIDKGEILDLLCSALDMTEADLQACQGKTLLSTARQVIGTKYPDESTTFADIPKAHLQAAAGESFPIGLHILNSLF